jgi:hypothetical protein
MKTEVGQSWLESNRPHMKLSDWKIIFVIEMGNTREVEQKTFFIVLT